MVCVEPEKIKTCENFQTDIVSKVTSIFCGFVKDNLKKAAIQSPIWFDYIFLAIVTTTSQAPMPVNDLL